MTRQKLFVVAALFSLHLGCSTACADFVHLKLKSQPGDFVGQGKNWDLTYQTPSAAVNASIGGTLVDGLPTIVSFNLNNAGPGDTFANLSFGSNRLGIPLTIGTYLNAERTSFASSGHPGLDVSFQHRGSNKLTGQFTILDIHYSEVSAGKFSLLAFNATFEQHSEGKSPALFGQIEFNEPFTAVPEPSSFVLAGVGIIGILCMCWRKTLQLVPKLGL